jgi:hypothetical protein
MPKTLARFALAVSVLVAALAFGGAASAAKNHYLQWISSNTYINEATGAATLYVPQCNATQDTIVWTCADQEIDPSGFYFTLDLWEPGSSGPVLIGTASEYPQESGPSMLEVDDTACGTSVYATSNVTAISRFGQLDEADYTTTSAYVSC